MDIVTADGIKVNVGDRVFSHYTMTELVITGESDSAGWFDLRPVVFTGSHRGSREYLNGERICSLAHARRMGWLSS